MAGATTNIIVPSHMHGLASILSIAQTYKYLGNKNNGYEINEQEFPFMNNNTLYEDLIGIYNVAKAGVGFASTDNFGLIKLGQGYTGLTLQDMCLVVDFTQVQQILIDRGGYENKQNIKTIGGIPILVSEDFQETNIPFKTINGISVVGSGEIEAATTQYIDEMINSVNDRNRVRFTELTDSMDELQELINGVNTNIGRDITDIGRDITDIRKDIEFQDRQIARLNNEIGDIVDDINGIREGNPTTIDTSVFVSACETAITSKIKIDNGILTVNGKSLTMPTGGGGTTGGTTGGGTSSNITSSDVKTACEQAITGKMSIDGSRNKITINGNAITIPTVNDIKTQCASSVTEKISTGIETVSGGARRWQTLTVNGNKIYIPHATHGFVDMRKPYKGFSGLISRAANLLGGGLGFPDRVVQSGSNYSFAWKNHYARQMGKVALVNKTINDMGSNWSSARKQWLQQGTGKDIFKTISIGSIGPLSYTKGGVTYPNGTDNDSSGWIIQSFVGWYYKFEFDGMLSAEFSFCDSGGGYLGIYAKYGDDNWNLIYHTIDNTCTGDLSKCELKFEKDTEIIVNRNNWPAGVHVSVVPIYL